MTQVAVVCLGEALVDFVARETVPDVGEAATFSRAAGGAPANVAVGLAQLGVAVAFIGKVGDDPFGRYLTRVLADTGVDTSDVRFTARARTGLAFVALDAARRPDFVFYRAPSADQLLTPDEVREPATRGRVLHTGGVTLSGGPAANATRDAMTAARQAGRLVSFDPNLRLNLWPSVEVMRRVVRGALPLADIVKCSAEELALLTGDDDVEAGIAALGRLGVRVAAVTRGPAGALGWAGGEIVAVDGFEIDAIDTTGCGDGFTAGLLTGLLAPTTPDDADRPLDLRFDASRLADILRLANAVGALTATRAGAIPALPTRADVTAFLTERAGLSAARMLEC